MNAPCTWLTGLEASVFADESNLLALMQTVREVCSAGSALRQGKKIRVRQPLQKMTVAIAPEQFAALGTAFGEKGAEYFANIVEDELNPAPGGAGQPTPSTPPITASPSS